MSVLSGAHFCHPQIYTSISLKNQVEPRMKHGRHDLKGGFRDSFIVTNSPCSFRHLSLGPKTHTAVHNLL